MGKTSKMPSSKAWRRKYIYYPLTPFLIEFVFKWLFKGGCFEIKLLYTTTLPVSVGILCLLVSQNLLELRRTYELENDKLHKNDCEEIHGVVAMFNIFSIISFFCFAVMVFFNCLYEYKDIKFEDIQNRINIGIFIFIIIPIIFATSCQSAFKLKASSL